MSYDLIAPSYYDPRRPTVANFDSATRAGIDRLKLALPTAGIALETGCGRGRLQEYCGISKERIVQCDYSLTMLTLPDRESARLRVRTDATRLPFASGSCAIVAAFLFDSYNSESFMKGVFEVLTPGGVFLGTLPHIEWGAAFRRTNGESADRAGFPMPGGGVLQVDSFLTEPHELRRRMLRAGFEKIALHDFRLPENSGRVSPHVTAAAESVGKSADSLNLIQFIYGARPL